MVKFPSSSSEKNSLPTLFLLYFEALFLSSCPVYPRLLINGLKIVFIFHPLPTLPPQSRKLSGLSPGGRGQG
jgi:hypothetical protein